jgi:alpha-galactosidase
MYYSLYAAQWKGPVQLRGLGAGSYRVHDIFNDRDLGTVDARASTLETAFEKFLLLRATPV